MQTNNSDHVADTSVHTAMKVAVYQNQDGFLFGCQEHFQNPWATRVSDVVEIPYVDAVPASPRAMADINKPRAVNDDLVKALQQIVRVASGEDQVADDDTEGMAWIDKHARAALAKLQA